ncbi:Endoribonuclease L-PSP/chorismate mutase-like protein [Butyriboletus roseoflavus]|nr:Endoribonuclease L-PSP/chorismate mutase-like protein [Butyriboletus roseoflavus]
MIIARLFSRSSLLLYPTTPRWTSPSPSHSTRFRPMSTVTTHASLTPVSTAAAAAAIGPYSQAIKAGDLVFVSGCMPINPSISQIVEGGIVPQAEQALSNLKAIVEASGSDLGRVVKTNLFLKDMNDFVTVNNVYAKFFGNHKPARSTVEVARLPKDVLFEIECVARTEYAMREVVFISQAAWSCGVSQAFGTKADREDLAVDRRCKEASLYGYYK